jgi:hypothetical protein
MIATETVALVRVIRGTWPSMRIDEFTPDAWHPLLEDIPGVLALGAVKSLAKVSSAYIAPADIRRWVANYAGLLAPGEDDAWDRALSVAQAEGEGRSQLHPVVSQTYLAMGGSANIRLGLPGPTRAQFGQIYKRLKDEYEREVLSGDLGVQIRGELSA